MQLDNQVYRERQVKWDLLVRLGLLDNQDWLEQQVTQDSLVLVGPVATRVNLANRVQWAVQVLLVLWDL